MAVKGLFENQLSIIRVNRQISDFLKQKNKKGAVIIIDVPEQYTVLNFGSITFEYAKRKSDDLIQGARQGLIKEIYAAQKAIMGSENKVLPGYELDPRFKLEKIFEFQNFEDRLVRVSRVLPP